MAKTVGRNDPCPCGSGKKYKHCCLEEAQAKRFEAVKPLAPAVPPLEATEPNPLGTPHPPREETPEDLRWRTFWARYRQGSLDDQLAMAHEMVATEANFDGDLAFDLCVTLHKALRAVGRYDDIDGLFRRIERERGDAYREKAAWFALWQAEAELVAARGRELEAVLSLGEHYAEAIDTGQEVVDRLRFHGRGDLLEPLLAAAWRCVHGTDKVTPSGERALQRQYGEAILARHRARNSALTADDGALLDDLAPLFDSRDSAARAVAPLIPASPRRWVYEDFARAHDPDDATVGALVVGFGAALESRWGFHPLRTLMMLDSVHDVVMQGLERPGKRNGGTPRLARPTAREPFAVVPRSALELRRAHSDFLTTHVYSLAAALFALPHWGEYLAEQGLVAGASARGAWRRFLDEARPELGELLVKSLEERHDRAAAEEVRAFLLHS